MPTFIKTGYWEKIQKGYKGWLNLDDLISSSVGTGSAGQIAYFGTSGLSGSSSLVWDAVNSRLGIGVASPLYRLHIVSATSLDAVYNCTLATGNTTIYLDNDANNGLRMNTWGSTATGTLLDGTVNRASASAIRTNNNTSTLVFGGLSTSASLVYFGNTGFTMSLNNSTNSVAIGTGTFAAGYKLDVNGAARVQGLFSSYGADFFVAQSAGAGADYFHVDDDPNLSAGANNQTIGLIRLRDRGGNGAFTGVNRVGIIMENSSGGSYPFQLFSESGNIRIGYSTVAASTSKLSIRGGSNDNTQLTIIATASNDTATLRAYNSNQVIVGAGGTLSASAALQVESTTRGFLPPRVTTVEKTAITTPTAGLVVYDTTLNKLCVYTGAAWQTVSSA